MVIDLVGILEDGVTPESRQDSFKVVRVVGRTDVVFRLTVKSAAGVDVSLSAITSSALRVADRNGATVFTLVGVPNHALDCTEFTLASTATRSDKMAPGYYLYEVAIMRSLARDVVIPASTFFVSLGLG